MFERSHEEERSPAEEQGCAARPGQGSGPGHRAGPGQGAVPHEAGERLTPGEVRDISVRLKHLAGSIARQQAEFLRLIDRIDAAEAWGGCVGIRSLAQWVSLVCEMDLHTAREHIRVMRGLRRMPKVAALLSEGRISFTKAREITRLAGRIPDEDAAVMCQNSPASQLQAAVSVWRRLEAPRSEDLARIVLPEDRVVVTERRAGRTRIVMDLPEDEAEEVLAAFDAARDRLERSGSDEPLPDHQRPTRVDGALEVVRAYAEEHTRAGRVRAPRATVVVHVAAETLVRGAGADSDVPAGTSQMCFFESGHPATAATAGRLACGAELIGVLKDRSADVLALGRSRRLATRKQRLALLSRDVHCQFPACGRRHHLEAHHIQTWSQGGDTDLDNMLLLCRSHHIAVHEHGLQITRAEGVPFSGAMQATTGFEFHSAEGVHMSGRLGAAGLGPQTTTEALSATLVFGLDGRENRNRAGEPGIATVTGGAWYPASDLAAWLLEATACVPAGTP